MRIDRLVVHNYRNIKDLTVEANPRFNVIHGQNAQGKTNFLEAVYLVGTLKSFRSAKNAELIHWDEEAGAVRAVVQRRESERDIVVKIGKSGKRVSVDGKHVRKFQDTFGHLHVVVFSTEDLIISKGSASNRRTFMDRAVFQYVPGHASTTKSYENALKSRNALLKDMRSSGRGDEMLDVFDPQVVEYGSHIISQRLAFIRQFRSWFLETHDSLCAGLSKVELRYLTDINITEESSIDEIKMAFSEAILRNRRKDIQRGFTTIGPHADDLDLSLDDRGARSFASQGQHRTLVLALKIAEINFLNDILGFRPVLLLDDVSSELDRSRNEQLMKFLLESAGQVFISTTDPDYLSIEKNATHFRMEDGILTEEKVMV